MIAQIAPVDIVSIKDSRIWLNTGLDETMFGKTKFSLLLDKQGLTVKKIPESENHTFENWKFDESKTTDEKVYFSGNFQGKSLQNLIECQHPLLDKILYELFTIYIEAASKNIPLPCNGATGIIINIEKNETLFLPEETFNRSIANFGKQVYNFYQDGWRDSVETGNKAIEFAAGVLAYFAISKKLPFNEETDLKISDRNFIPLEYCVNGINQKLSDAISTLLKGERLKKDFPINLLEEELFQKESKNHAVSEELFRKKSESFNSERTLKLKRSRFVQRNWPKVAAALAFLIFAGISTASILNENEKKPCMIGLDSTEVTEVFYKGIHTMDTDLMLAAAKDCPEAQRYISQVPQLYVTGQMRSAYNFESGISTPENWFFLEPDSTRSYSHYIYGISHFSIDEKDTPLDLKVPTRKNHPGRKIMAESGDQKIEKDPDAEHTVRYYLVHNQDNQIAIEQFTTKVTLKYIKNRWQILKLDQTSSYEIQSPLPVSLAMKEALRETEGNVIKAADIIRKGDFYWIPTARSLEIEEKRLDAIGY